MTPKFYMRLDIDDASSRARMNVRQNDNGRLLLVALFQSGRPFFVDDDCRAVIAGTRPDGLTIFNDAQIVDGNVIYELTPNTTGVVGTVYAELRIYGPDDDLLASPTFSIEVGESAMDEGDLADGPEATALSKLIQEADAAIKATEASVIRAATAELTENGGAPSASVELAQEAEGQKINFNFANLRGPQGVQGPQGPAGPAGEAAPDTAVLYTPQTLPIQDKRQARLNIDLEPLTFTTSVGDLGYPSSLSFSDLQNAAVLRRPIICMITTTPLIECQMVSIASNEIVFAAVAAESKYARVTCTPDGIKAEIIQLASVPFEKPLTFTGAVNETYDGSEPVTINIPSGGGGVTDEEALELLIELDMLPAVTNAAGAILTDSNSNIILRY